MAKEEKMPLPGIEHGSPNTYHFTTATCCGIFVIGLIAQIYVIDALFPPMSDPLTTSHIGGNKASMTLVETKHLCHRCFVIGLIALLLMNRLFHHVITSPSL